MQTSNQGREFLERHEGVVLRAYRCPAGVWTIGAGLTAASGVVAPSAGMVITPQEASRLLSEALARRYEPSVRRAMPGAKQHEFDAGVSFHFNTGAITRASWVPAWASGNRPAMRERLARWNRGGGKVLPGLARRRQAEADLIDFAAYGGPVPARVPRGLARVTLDLSRDEIAAARRALEGLGYAVGADPRGVAEPAVRAFQRVHGLTEDGILGRATLSTLQRVIDSRQKALAPVGATAVGGADSAVQLGADLDPALAWAGPALLAIGALWLAWLAWQYRDTLAGALHPKLPRLAAWLRSF